MGLFSFGNKDAAPARRSRTSAGAERHGETRTARASRASGASGGGRSGQESLLDPTLPEKQRARRRLVGAIALVLAAVVVLPMVLDSHPKPASDDIAVNIPRVAKTPAAPSAMNAPAPDVTGADLSPSDNPPPTPMSSSADTAAAEHNASLYRGNVASQVDGLTASAALAAAVKRGNAANPPGAQTNTQNQAKPPQQMATASHNAADVSSNPSNSPAVVHPPATVPSSAASRFVVSVGSFASDASAHAWLNKLKAAGVPAYLETKRSADGTQRTLLRAGPFSDRANAEAAVKKVREAGLSAQSSTQSSGQGPASGSAQ